MIRNLCALAIVSAGLIAPANIQQDQAFFAILAETKVGRMAGMPVMDLGDLPPGFSLPPEAMMFAGVPARILNMRLWSPGLAPANATASVAPPAGLKQGAKLDLELYRPKSGQTTAEPRSSIRQVRQTSPSKFIGAHHLLSRKANQKSSSGMEFLPASKLR